MADLPNNQKPEEKTIEEKPIEIGSIKDDNLTKKSETPETQTDKPKPKEEISTPEIKPEEKMPPLPETSIEPEVGTISNVGNETSQEPIVEDKNLAAQQPKEEESKTKTIDINSIDNFGSKPKKKINVKSLSSILGILIIIAALPMTLMLVKQRQEIRKEAAGEVERSTGSVTQCGVTVSAGNGNFNGSNLTGNYSFKNNSSKTIEMKVHLYGCACNDGNRSTCGTNSGDCKGQEKTVTIGANSSTSVSWSTPSKNNCGTFQTDLFVMACKQL